MSDKMQTTNRVEAGTARLEGDFVSMRSSSILALLLLGTIVIATAQAPRKPAATAPRPSADVLARRQFAAALEEYRAQPGSSELRDKVIRLAKGLKSAPAIPEEASKSLADGMAKIQSAATPENLKAAAKLFEQAAQAAPWYSEAYYNLGGVYDKLGDYDKEKEWLRIYVTTLRDEASVKAGQDLIKEADTKQVQEVFEQAVAAIKRNPSDLAARQRLVHQAASFNPPLPVPEEAERYMARGKVAFEDAKEQADFKDAVLQFQRARDAAPWYGPIYYSLGVAQSTAGDYNAAKQNLSVYLAWALDPGQTKAAKELIYQIDYRQEKAQAEDTRRQADADAERRKLQAKRALLAGLNGQWSCRQGCNGAATIRLSQGNFNLSVNNWTMSGALNEFAVEGIATQAGFYHSQSTCQVPGSNHNFTATISEDGKTITVHTEENNYIMHWNTTGGLFPRTTCTDYSVSHVDPVMIILSRAN
jgi:tetratricopeptide (TPR) repeat protein